jgi:hypothetical protein
MITYLCIIVPFLEYINPDWNSNGYIFTDGKGDSWDTAKQSKIMSRESLSRIGFRITTAKWRQIQVALDREFVRTKRKDEDEDDDSEMEGEDDIHEGQAGHTPIFYAVPKCAALLGGKSPEVQCISKNIAGSALHLSHVVTELISIGYHNPRV